jgi:hypothetical protein
LELLDWKTSIAQDPEIFHIDFPSVVVIADEPTFSPTPELLLPTTIPLAILFAMTTVEVVRGMGETAVIGGMGMGEPVMGGMGMDETAKGGMAMGDKADKVMEMGEKEMKAMGMGEMTMADMMRDKRSERYLRTPP